MNTRHSVLKKAIDLKPGDIIDFRCLGNGYGIKFHLVVSDPSRRQSDPSQVVFQCQVWDPDDLLPEVHEGRQSTSAFAAAEELIRLPVSKPHKIQSSWK